MCQVCSCGLVFNFILVGEHYFRFVHVSWFSTLYAYSCARTVHVGWSSTLYECGWDVLGLFMRAGIKLYRSVEGLCQVFHVC